MNCPHHIQIYQAEPRSYRDLPVRLAEFGTVYRFEQIGRAQRHDPRPRLHPGRRPPVLHRRAGRRRVPRLHRDDAVRARTRSGLNDYRVRLGFRDPKSDKYVGSAEVWERAEDALEDVCSTSSSIDYTAEPGEAAFYGPKADFVVTDCIGREWQLGTVQLDYNLPAQRFGSNTSAPTTTRISR